MRSFPEHATIIPAGEQWPSPWLDDAMSLDERTANKSLAMPEAREYILPDVTLANLALGRLGIFNAIMDHQTEEGLDARDHVFAGINGISLVKIGRLFSDLNPSADLHRLNASFFATQAGHWREVVGEAKYPPITYIYKAAHRGTNPFPAIVGFDLTKLEPTYAVEPKYMKENMQWSPVLGETTESAVKSIYYFEGMFIDS